MNFMNEALSAIKRDYGLDISNKSYDNTIWFSVNNNTEVFKTNTKIYFRSITGSEEFIVNIEAGDCSYERFEEIKKAFEIVKILNYELIEYSKYIKA